ncbi:MAG: ATP-binding protein [Candidatus Thiodiazotropha sp.]
MAKKTLDATPEKRIFLSIISEYDLKRSICELIDNAIDLWTRTKREDLVIRIELDTRQQSISIHDNAGGLEEDRLDHIISPGKTSNDIDDSVIGYFGVGSKRAVVALAKDISIKSRFGTGKTFLVKLDEDWITNDSSWHLPYTEAPAPLSPSSTVIELGKLRIHVSKDDTEELKAQLSEIYARFIESGVTIEIDGEILGAIHFDDEWSYPPKLLPTRFIGAVEIEGRMVEVEILSGLIDHPGDPDDSYGVFVYCNNRLISRGLKDFSVGFTSGLVGNPHYNVSLARTIVSLIGQSQDMPWDSSKSSINAKHEIWQSIRKSVIDATKRYAQVSRSLQGVWEKEVFKHSTGNIENAKLDNIENIPKSYLPKPAPSRTKWHQKIINKNAATLRKKRWAAGILDSILAADMIFGGPLAHKNRISLIVLDSTLEIAYKEYLVSEVGIGVRKFKEISENRKRVQDEVLKHIPLDEDEVKKINHYYKMRCDLIHQRATPNVGDDDIEDYRAIVGEVLEVMFGIEL